MSLSNEDFVTLHKLFLDHGLRKTLPPGAKIEPPYLHFLQEGSISEGIYIPDYNTDIITRIISEPTLFNTEILFCDTSIYSYYCRIKSVFLSIPRLRIPKELDLYIAKAQHAKTLLLAERIYDYNYTSGENRILKVLLSLEFSNETISHPNGYIVRITREDLSKMIDFTREQTAKLLNRLEERKLISVLGKTILVHRR